MNLLHSETPISKILLATIKACKDFFPAISQYIDLANSYKAKIGAMSETAKSISDLLYTIGSSGSQESERARPQFKNPTRHTARTDRVLCCRSGHRCVSTSDQTNEQTRANKRARTNERALVARMTASLRFRKRAVQNRDRQQTDRNEAPRNALGLHRPVCDQISGSKNNDDEERKHDEERFFIWTSTTHAGHDRSRTQRT